MIYLKVLIPKVEEERKQTLMIGVPAILVVCFLIITILRGQSQPDQSTIAKQSRAIFNYFTETCSALFGIFDFLVLVTLLVQHIQANCDIFQLAISAMYIVFTLMEFGSLTRDDWQRF